MDGRRAGIEIGGDGDGHLVLAECRHGRGLLFAQVIEGAGKQHGHGAGLGNRFDSILIQIFDVIDGEGLEARRHFRSAQIGELFGMQFHRQFEGSCGLEYGSGFFHGKGNAFAKAINGIGQSFRGNSWKRLIANNFQVGLMVFPEFLREKCGPRER